MDFNPRSHERSDDFNRVPKCCWCHISIHAPTRGATRAAGVRIRHRDNFNPRSHERSDLMQIVYIIKYRLFQSTLPREERPFAIDQTSRLSTDLNPRSHERSDPEGITSICYSCTISIHAPTRGATIVKVF